MHRKALPVAELPVQARLQPAVQLAAALQMVHRAEGGGHLAACWRLLLLLLLADNSTLSVT